MPLSESRQSFGKTSSFQQHQYLGVLDGDNTTKLYSTKGLT